MEDSQESSPGGLGGVLADLVKAEAKVRYGTGWPRSEPELLNTEPGIWRQFGSICKTDSAKSMYPLVWEFSSGKIAEFIIYIM